MKLAAANWKLNLPPEGIEGYFKGIEINGHTDVTICAPASHIFFVPPQLRGAQNVSEYEKGAYTGEISAPILSSLDVKYCIIGHSERREYFGESLEKIKLKYKALINAGIKPIVCFGEKINDKENFKRCLDEITNFSSYISNSALVTLDYVIAYEPIWAIGTGVTPSNEEIESRLSQIKEISNTMVLYGGSVTKENIHGLAKLPSLDGVLVGGASLNAISFTEIVKSLAE